MQSVNSIRRSRRLTSILLASLAIGALLVGRPALAQRSGIDFLPLSVGNTWTYDGTIWWVPRNSLRVLEERVTLEMEVLEVVERTGARAARMKGNPRHLITSAADRFEGEFTLIQVGPRVYFLRGERGREALRRIRDPNDSLADLIRASELVLDLPLEQGKTFCSAGLEGLAGTKRCWSVRGETSPEWIPVAGSVGATYGEPYVLDLRSGAEQEVRAFVPGLGFTSIAIGNVGDPAALELDLVEVDLAPSRGTFLKTLDLDEPTVEMARASHSSEISNPEPPSGSSSSPRADADDVPDEVPSLALQVAEYTKRSCADDREWFTDGKPIEFEGLSLDPMGTPEPISLDNLVPVGEYDQVTIYVGRYAGQPRTDFWLPLCRTPDTYRRYVALN